MFNQGKVSATIKNAVKNDMDFTEYKAFWETVKLEIRIFFIRFAFNKSQERLLSLGKANEKLN